VFLLGWFCFCCMLGRVVGWGRYCMLDGGCGTCDGCGRLGCGIVWFSFCV